MMMQRCGSNATARSSFSSNSGGGMGSLRRCFVDGGSVMKRRQEEQYALERNRSARYSPAHHADNGMLRFYLTPLFGAPAAGVQVQLRSLRCRRPTGSEDLFGGNLIPSSSSHLPSWPLPSWSRVRSLSAESEAFWI
jgi:hypothetical protein